MKLSGNVSNINSCGGGGGGDDGELVSTGKHMIMDIKQIRNMNFLNDMGAIKNMFETICAKYDFTILSKSEHQFSPQGITVLYMLSESHISIHTFPEHRYAAMDIYTCRVYPNNDVYREIYDYVLKCFDTSISKEDSNEPVIFERSWR